MLSKDHEDKKESEEFSSINDVLHFTENALRLCNSALILKIISIRRLIF